MKPGSRRRRIGFLIGASTFLTLLGCAPGAGYEPRDGDIVFHTSRSSQSLAIQLATKSPYSHMGIVYLRDGKPFVFEAVQPVKLIGVDMQRASTYGRRVGALMAVPEAKPGAECDPQQAELAASTGATRKRASKPRKAR